MSHDLPLLDASITSVLALENGTLEPYRGTYSFYLEEKERRRAQRIRENTVRERQIAQLEATARRFMGTTEKMSKRAHGMQTRADKMKERLVEVAARSRRVNLQFPQPEASGRIPSKVSGSPRRSMTTWCSSTSTCSSSAGSDSSSWDSTVPGKTTLLRILAGEETADIGEVKRGYKTSLGYYAQEHEQIRPGTDRDGPHPQRRGRCHRCNAALGARSLPSRGQDRTGCRHPLRWEKTKLALAMLVVGKHNVLLLDEPTNNPDRPKRSGLCSRRCTPTRERSCW